MENFTPVSAVIGGLLIGGAAALLLVFNGRIAGISGILGSLLWPQRGDWLWRAAFIGGILAAPLLVWAVTGSRPSAESDAPAVLVIVAGLLVGFGTSLGSGCTSGHGICGLARLSPRSILATLVFMAAGVATVFATRHLMGM